MPAGDCRSRAGSHPSCNPHQRFCGSLHFAEIPGANPSGQTSVNTLVCKSNRSQWFIGPMNITARPLLFSPKPLSQTHRLACLRVINRLGTDSCFFLKQIQNLLGVCPVMSAIDGHHRATLPLTTCEKRKIQSRFSLGLLLPTPIEKSQRPVCSGSHLPVMGHQNRGRLKVFSQS